MRDLLGVLSFVINDIFLNSLTIVFKNYKTLNIYIKKT